MKVTTFSEKVATLESGKKSISIAQIKEVLKHANALTGGVFYKLIKSLK